VLLVGFVQPPHNLADPLDQCTLRIGSSHHSAFRLAFIARKSNSRCLRMKPVSQGSDIIVANSAGEQHSFGGQSQLVVREVIWKLLSLPIPGCPMGKNVVMKRCACVPEQLLGGILEGKQRFPLKIVAPRYQPFASFITTALSVPFGDSAIP
jgi:hypothetical protein